MKIRFAIAVLISVVVGILTYGVLQHFNIPYTTFIGNVTGGFFGCGYLLKTKNKITSYEGFK